MIVKRFVFNDFKVNTYVLVDDKTMQGLVIDPGMYYEDEYKIFEQYLESNEIDLKYIVLTHGHFDHFCGGEKLQSQGVSLMANQRIMELASRIDEFAVMFGINIEYVPSIDAELTDNDEIILGDLKLKVIETPGHCPGHLCLLAEKEKILFSGDLLFKNTIGRTDLPGADYDALVHSIKDKILSLKEDYQVMPGHGPQTTIADELLNNPFILNMYG